MGSKSNNLPLIRDERGEILGFEELRKLNNGAILQLRWKDRAMDMGYWLVRPARWDNDGFFGQTLSPKKDDCWRSFCFENIREITIVTRESTIAGKIISEICTNIQQLRDRIERVEKNFYKLLE